MILATALEIGVGWNKNSRTTSTQWCEQKLALLHSLCPMLFTSLGINVTSAQHPRLGKFSLLHIPTGPRASLSQCLSTF